MGGNNSAEKQSQALATTQANTAQQEVGIAQQQLDLSQQTAAKANQLQQPLVNFYSGIVSPGNKTNAISAASPLIGNIANSEKQAEGNIRNTVPEGAGRDAALALAKIQQGQSTSSALNSTYTSALQNLAQLGSADQGVALQQTGAGLSAFGGANQGFGGAQSALGTIQQAQASQKAALTGTLGSIFGAAGTAAGGYLGKA